MSNDFAQQLRAALDQLPRWEGPHDGRIYSEIPDPRSPVPWRIPPEDLFAALTVLVVAPPRAEAEPGERGHWAEGLEIHTVRQVAKRLREVAAKKVKESEERFKGEGGAIDALCLCWENQADILNDCASDLETAAPPAQPEPPKEEGRDVLSPEASTIGLPNLDWWMSALELFNAGKWYREPRPTHIETQWFERWAEPSPYNGSINIPIKIDAPPAPPSEGGERKPPAVERCRPGEPIPFCGRCGVPFSHCESRGAMVPPHYYAAELYQPRCRCWTLAPTEATP